jgi:hypothetical protein
LVSTRWFLHYLQTPGKNYPSLMQRLPRLPGISLFYWTFLMRYFLVNHKLLIAGIKLYNCLMLYLMCRNLTADDYDLRMPFLFYFIGLMGHGVLIHKLRAEEELRMAFYRSLPLSLGNRFIQYAGIYLLLLLPEMITIILLAPAYLQYKDAFLLSACSYAILLMLNSISFVRYFTMRDYLKIVLLLFFVLYFFVLAESLLWGAVLFFLTALYLFFTRYYKYE